MVMIISDQGYPTDKSVLMRVDYYIDTPLSEGGILVVGKDSKGREYKLDSNSIGVGSYTLPSGVSYGVPVGSEPEKNHPALYFPFQLNILDSSKIIDDSLSNEEFWSNFEFTLMNESLEKIKVDKKVEQLFKDMAVWGPVELVGLVRNHFWGEMYRKRTPNLEIFLEDYNYG